jgi:F-type H+-transporting ATPase subunit b
MASAAMAATNATEAGGGGLPQFEFQWWAGEIFWMLVVFGLLLFLFARVFVPRIGGTIAAREDKIGGDIGEARRLRDEAEAQSRDAADELAQARARAQKLAADAKAAAAAESMARQGEEEARLAQVLAEAEAGIAAARADAMGHVRTIAADAAQAIVQRLTGESAGSAEVERALASLA